MLTGGAGDDVLIGNGGLDVLDGGTGNNIVIPSTTAPVGNAGSLVGAVAAQANIAPRLQADGTVGSDVIGASSMSSPSMRFIATGGDLLRGGAADELLVGGPGADRFVFSGRNGTDTIADFQHGVDTIELHGYGAALDSFADLAGHITQVGADVRVDLGAKVAGAGTIMLEHTQLATMSASDFKFS